MTESNATISISNLLPISGNTKANILFGLTFETMPSISDLVESKQGYYWTKDWQEGEREADKDIETKNWDTFLSAKEAIDYLHKLKDGSNKSD